MKNKKYKGFTYNYWFSIKVEYGIKMMNSSKMRAFLLMAFRSMASFLSDTPLN
jgi:hypothetical protein